MTKKRESAKPLRVCGDCIHELPCFYAGGGCGNLTNTDATHCVNYDTLTSYLEKYARIMGYEKRGEAKDVNP